MSYNSWHFHPLWTRLKALPPTTNTTQGFPTHHKQHLAATLTQDTKTIIVLFLISNWLARDPMSLAIKYFYPLKDIWYFFIVTNLACFSASLTRNWILRNTTKTQNVRLCSFSHQREDKDSHCLISQEKLNF